MLDKFTLRAFVIVTAWIGLLSYIAYAVYKYPDLVLQTYDTVLGIAISITSVAIGRYLFEQKQ
ncbi:MAG: hypothetical protein QXJ45_06920 [Thermoproteota archaeon]